MALKIMIQINSYLDEPSQVLLLLGLQSYIQVCQLIDMRYQVNAWVHVREHYTEVTRLEISTWQIEHNVTSNSHNDTNVNVHCNIIIFLHGDLSFMYFGFI